MMEQKKQGSSTNDTALKVWHELLHFCSHAPSLYSKFEKDIRYTFQDKSGLYEALTHKSALLAFRKKKKNFDISKSGLNHYERIEFLGDSVLGLIISSMLWTQKNPHTGALYSEGELSRIKAFLVSESTLAQIAEGLNLDQLILQSKAERTGRKSLRKSLLADCFEALLGAIFSDGGYQHSRRFLKRVYKEIMKKDLLELSLDYKSQLQEIIQNQEKQSPHYETIETSGPDHEKKFKVAVYFEENKLGSAWGDSKKKASQEAAKEALQNLKQNKS